MADGQQFMDLLESWGMPKPEWYKRSDLTYYNLCSMLTTDINSTERVDGPNLPRVSILPIGNFACRLSSQGEVLKCVAFGSIRKELFAEVVWQNITAAQARGMQVKPLVVSEKWILLDLSGFVFSVCYIESPEVVRS